MPTFNFKDENFKLETAGGEALDQIAACYEVKVRDVGEDDASVRNRLVRNKYVNYLAQSIAAESYRDQYQFLAKEDLLRLDELVYVIDIGDSQKADIMADSKPGRCDVCNRWRDREQGLCGDCR